MLAKQQFLSVLFVLLLISAEWGAKCEVEKIPFVAEVGRYSKIDTDSWISSSTLSIPKRKSSLENSSLMRLTHSIKSSSWPTVTRAFWEIKQNFRSRYNMTKIGRLLKSLTMELEWPRTNLLIIWELSLNQVPPSSYKTSKLENSTLSDSSVSASILLSSWLPKSKSFLNITTTINTNGYLLPPTYSQYSLTIQSNSREVHWLDFTWKRTPLNTASMTSLEDSLRGTAVLLIIPFILRKLW